VHNKQENQDSLKSKGQNVLVKGMQLKCLYANVDQLLNKIDDLKLLISYDTPDVILFTEVIPKAQRNQIHESLLQLPDFQLYTNFNFDTENLGSSGIRGVAIYVKEDLNSQQVICKSQYNDQIWVEINLRGHEKIICGCVYRTPSKDKKIVTDTLSEICAIMDEMTKKNYSRFLMCGDFNYPEIDWLHEYIPNSSIDIMPFMNSVQELNLHQHVVNPTRHRYDHESSLGFDIYQRRRDFARFI